MNKKYQVFVSSTYKDLQEARAKVRDAILSMYHFPVGMELFGAANEEQWQIISETIDSSDYFIMYLLLARDMVRLSQKDFQMPELVIRKKNLGMRWRKACLF